MKTLLGLSFFSVLLAPGNPLWCETCTEAGDTCTGPVKECAPGEDMCANITMQAYVGSELVDKASKKCISDSDCAAIKANNDEVVRKVVGDQINVKSIECSKALTSSGSFLSGSLLLAVSGLLLLKLLP